MMNSEQLQKRKFYCFDPVAYLLVEKLHLSPLNLGLLSILFATGIYMISAWLSNTLWSKPGQVGLLQDWFPWIWVLFISPVVLGYYLWSFQAIDNVIQDLEASDVVEIDKSELDKIILNLYYKRWYKFLALASAISFSVFVLDTRFNLKESWTGSGLVPIWTVTIATFMVVYMGSILILNLITNVRVLHQILTSKKLNINPLHPDRCGGLRSLSEYALKTAYLAAILGIMVGFIEYQFIKQGVERDYWFVHLIIPLHVFLSIACFLGPLVAAHRGMQKAREELLHQIARQFHTDYLQSYICLVGDAETLKKSTAKIQELRTLYAFTNEFPIWPFDLQTFRRFLLSISTPLVPIVIGLGPKLLKVMLKKWGI